MGTPSTLRNRKRASPRSSAYIEDEMEVTKRRRSDGKHNENGTVPLVAGVPVTPALAATPMAERRLNQAGKPPEAGVIVKIYVENFMCHKKLTVELCRNVNFIYGQNGSGKSAILAAIQICLGAGARRTHRARNLKELVRKDATCACAKIRVTLLNRGIDGYHPEIYGDTITVERTIAMRGGYNGYKLYDQNMQEQSRSKKDLDDMLDKLNIQVENPVAILDQEEAKKFLTGKAEDKYNFFMKATELERIDRTYCGLVDKKADMDHQATRLRATLEADIALVAETKQRYEQHKEIEKMERKLENYNEGYAWAIYGEEAEALEKEAQSLGQHKEKIAKKKEELKQAEEEASAPDEAEQAKRSKLEELSNEAQKQSQMKHDLEADLKRAVEPQKAAERKLKVLQKSQKSAQDSLKKANKRLQQRRDEIIAQEGTAESEAAIRTQRLKDAEEKYSKATEKQDELKQAVTDAYKAYEAVEPHVEQAKQDCSAVKTKLNAVHQRIKGLKSSSGNSLAVFGQRCTKVKQMVDQASKQRKFKGPVVGPIGAYVQIVPGKEQLASLAELALGVGTLDRFVVTNDHDRKVFQDIRKKAGCQQDCGVFQVTPHPKYNIPPPPVDGIETVASVLSISDDLVFNCLVDNSKIEERALSVSKEESERMLLKRSENGRYSILGKIKNVYCLPQGDSWSLRDGMINMTANEKKLRQTIGVDRSEAIAEAENEAKAIEAEYKTLRENEAKLEHEHLDLQKQWNKAKKASQQNTRDIDKFVALIDEIKNEQVSASNIDTDTSEYEQEVEEAQEAVRQLKEQEKQLSEDIAEKNPEIDEIKARLKEMRTRNEKVLNDIRVAEDELAKHVHNLSQRQEKLERKRDKLQKYEADVQRLEETVNEMRERVAEYLDGAKRLAYQRMKREEREALEEQGQQIDDSQFSQDPTEEELKAIEIMAAGNASSHYATKIKRFEKKIKEEKRRRNANKDDPVIAYEKYSRAKAQLQAKTEQCEEIEKYSAMLKIDVKERRKRWKQFREHIAGVTDMKFDEILNQKGSSGGIDFDYNNGELNLIVQKDSRDENSQQKDVKALSGGERSYTTIALLLALGESLETPFRVLDEFDVFLDAITRKLTIEALIKMAKSMQHRQFIFITPQDVSNVETDPMLKVLKMTPPKRNSVAGGLSQGTIDFPSQP